jgi:prepilin-type N-terminal cleavage/methylation domain-containing protein
MGIRFLKLIKRIGLGHDERGLSLVELMVAMSILSIGVLGFIAAFGGITKSMHISRAKTLANNLVQEKVENLKNVPYYKLAITTAAAADNDFSPALYYDPHNYDIETIKIGGITFYRYAIVFMAEVTNGDITSVALNYPDTGMKAISVYVKWLQNGVWKYRTIDNVYENPIVDPLLASVYGQVTDGTNAVSGALVSIIENPDWKDTADANGSYSIAAAPGAYTLKASSAGYESATVTGVDLTSTTVPLTNIAISEIATGTVAGILWLNNGLVISQIVTSTTTVSDNATSVDVEYVELFNPTTYPINIGVTGGPKDHTLNYTDEDGGGDDFADSDFNWVHITTFVGSGQYYLFANASYFHILGEWVYADAYTTTDGQNAMNPHEAGNLTLTRVSDGENVDIVGWSDDDDTPPADEGTGIPDPSCGDGPGIGLQMVRVSSPLLTSNTYGRAYDSNDNQDDFEYPTSDCTALTWFRWKPHSSTTSAQTVIAGKPGLGANATADDTMGASATAFDMGITSNALTLSVALFEMTGVATGTWTVIVASGTYLEDVDDVVVTQSALTPIPNATTSPSWKVANHFALFLDSATVKGFVRGTVTDINGAGLAGIEIVAGGVPKTTVSGGTYFVATSTGTISVIANSNNANSQYVEAITQAAVTTGQLTTQDFILTEGGTITGFTSSDGTSVMPNIEVAASLNGAQAGLSTSDSAGVFYIRNLTTGTYSVAPVLDPMETYSPAAISAAVTPSVTVHVGTFTISGALGTLVGSVTNNGETITSGALIVASQDAIGTSPPDIVASSSPAQTPIYSGSSLADGSYALEMRGSGTTYNVSVFVPVISGASVSVTTKTYSGITMTANTETTLNITLP